MQARILAAELFVAVFTRREEKSSGGFTTSPWVIEEKAVALNAGKRLLLFVEDGVEKDIGGLQGDFEYVKFDRQDLADALIRSMDYVLSVTSIPWQCHVDVNAKRINLNIQGSRDSIETEIERKRKQKALEPKNLQVRLELAQLRMRNNDRKGAIAEFFDILRENPQLADVHHQLAHALEDDDDIEAALLRYQEALDRNNSEYKNYRCYGKCLYKKAKLTSDRTVRHSTLLKAKRLLERAAVVGGEQSRAEISGDLFLVDEAIKGASQTKRTPRRRNAKESRSNKGKRKKA